jgi:hypothetical protein
MRRSRIRVPAWQGQVVMVNGLSMGLHRLEEILPERLLEDCYEAVWSRAARWYWENGRKALDFFEAHVGNIPGIGVQEFYLKLEKALLLILVGAIRTLIKLNMHCKRRSFEVTVELTLRPAQ